jgi:hypothetical protein
MQASAEDEMGQTETARVALLWRGDHEARKSATPADNRFYRIFEELTAIGIEAQPAVYSDEIVD